jgi:hypothetical protein
MTGSLLVRVLWGVAPRGAFDATPSQFRLHDLAHCEAGNLPSSSALLFRFFAGKFVQFVFLLVSHGAYICVGTKHDTLTFALLVYSDKLEQGYENRRPQVILATLVAGLILYHRKMGESGERHRQRTTRTTTTGLWVK